MSTERLILVGAGAFARELAHWADDAHRAGHGPAVAGCLDDGEGRVPGLAHLGAIEAYVPREGDAFVLAIADPEGKQRVAAALSARGARFGRVVHPSVVVARSAEIGEGVVLCPQSVVSADARVGAHVAVNILSCVGHDVVLGAASTLSSQVDLTGRVVVGDACFFGSGARVLPGVEIGAGSRIGAGAVVVRKVSAGSVVYAPPARKL